MWAKPGAPLQTLLSLSDSFSHSLTDSFPSSAVFTAQTVKYNRTNHKLDQVIHFSDLKFHYWFKRYRGFAISGGRNHREGFETNETNFASRTNLTYFLYKKHHQYICPLIKNFTCVFESSSLSCGAFTGNMLYVCISHHGSR